MEGQTTIKISRKLNDELMIFARLQGMKKEVFVEQLLKRSLKPHRRRIRRLRFS